MTWEADWDDVLRRAETARRRTVRRAIVAVVAVAAVLIPLTALAAANDWWFLRDTSAPRPTHAPLVIKEGTWDGRAWQLVAYPSTRGLCLTMAPAGSSAGAALGCAPTDMPITFLTGSSELLPTYITGPVVENATEVEVKLADGRLIRAPTFAAPRPLDHVRFYLSRAPEQSAVAPQWLAGLDAKGHVVACLVPRTAKDGISPLSDCR